MIRFVLTALSFLSFSTPLLADTIYRHVVFPATEAKAAERCQEARTDFRNAFKKAYQIPDLVVSCVPYTDENAVAMVFGFDNGDLQQAPARRFNVHRIPSLHTYRFRRKVVEAIQVKYREWDGSRWVDNLENQRIERIITETKVLGFDNEAACKSLALSLPTDPIFEDGKVIAGHCVVGNDGFHIDFLVEVAPPMQKQP